MAKPRRWTVEFAMKYLERNTKTNRGLTFWSAYDYLRRSNVPAMLITGILVK